MNRPATILIVDDHPSNRETLVALLETAEYRLMEAADGPSALRLATATPPDLILLDVMMPGMDGFETCRRLRAVEQLAGVPIIMVTALDDQGSRLTGLDAGADDFVIKPFNRAELRARVKTITRLNRYRRLHEQQEQFQWVVEHAPDGYVQTRDTDEIVFANAKARRWLGFDDDDGEAARGSFWAAVQKQFTGKPESAWVDWPNGAAQPLGQPRLLVRPESPHAHATFLEVTIHENSGGRLLRLRDVTEHMAARQDQRSFQSMVSHKLRTPLNGVQGGLEILSDPSGLAPEEIAEFAQMALQSAARLNQAVQDVLRFADAFRPTNSGTEFSVDHLGALVARVSTDLALHTVAYEVESPLLTTRITGSAETLEWILVELLDNARKFHPRNDPKVTVNAGREPDGRIRVSVRDDGLHLSPEQIDRALTPFSQGEKSFTGEVPGMGLGLSAIAAAMWRHGGSCRLRNRADGPGICVELFWPAWPATANSPPITS